MKSTLAALTLTAALIAAAPAAAVQPGSYSGKTKSGYKMSFKVKGNKVSKLSGMVPASCISPTGGTRAGGELFRPPGKFAIGKTRKAKAKQQPAMHYSKVTKNYKVTLKKAKRGGFKAKLHVNFSFLTLDYGFDGPRLKSWICRGDDSFTAR
jgi:hypothetical protein